MSWRIERNTADLRVMKTSEEDKKNNSKSAPAWYLAMHLGEG